MAALRVRQVEEIAEHLLLLPALVERQEQRSPDFVRGCVAWLKALEAMLAANRLAEAGTIAAVRSGLVAAVRGAAPAGLEIQGTRTRARVAEAVASMALQRGADVATALIAPHQARLAEADRLARQLVAVSASRGGPGVRTSDEPYEVFLQGLRRSFAAHADLAGAASLLESLVGPHDALILIDRALAFVLAPA
jgi:hypothetical protein